MKQVLFILILAVSCWASASNFCSEVHRGSGLSQIETVVPAVKIKEFLGLEPAFFKAGKFKNQEVDQSERRPVQRLKELETDQHYFVTQFYHQGHFWMARIPKGAVRDVVFQLALFNGALGKTLAHAQIRFLTSEPLVLFRVKNGQVVSTSTKDFIFTFQAALPKGTKYSEFDAMRGNYLIVSRLANTFDRVYKEEILDGDIVTQYRLKGLSPEQMNLLLSNSVDFSTQNLITKRYNASKANCVNLTFDIIDQTLNLENPRLHFRLWQLLTQGRSPIEKMTLDALKERGLIDENSRLPDYTRK